MNIISLISNTLNRMKYMKDGNIKYQNKIYYKKSKLIIYLPHFKAKKKNEGN